MQIPTSRRTETDIGHGGIPDGKTRNQIDFILSSQPGIVEYCSVITNVDVGSDHRIVRAKILIDKKLERLKIIKTQRKSKTESSETKGEKT